MNSFRINFLHSGISNEQQTEVENLLELIQQNLSDISSPSIQKIDSGLTVTMEEAVILLQRIYRLQLLSTILFSPQGQKVYWDLLDRENLLETDTVNILLAKLMFGKTVAKTATNQYYPAEVKKPEHKSEYDFPVMQHCCWNSRNMKSTAGYHRWSDFDMTLAKKIADLYLDQPDHSAYKYLPVMETNNLKIETVIEKFDWNPFRFTDYQSKYRGLIKIYTKENETISILQIPDVLYARFYALLKPAGILASPFEIAAFLANKNEMKKEINERERNLRQLEKWSESYFFDHNKLFDNLLPSQPESLNNLINHPLMSELAGIAISSRPVKYLAAYLHRLISALPSEANIDGKYIQRISLFLSLAVKFQSMNYDRFAFLTHVITHEITLLLNQVSKTGMEITNYKKFTDNLEKILLSCFGLRADINNERNYQIIGAPANTGSHAFLMACELANKMLGHKNKPFIAYYAPFYFEFFHFMNSDIRLNNKNKTLADIYHISTGPVIMAPGSDQAMTIPGIDINLFVKYLLNIGLEGKTDGIVIIVDTTTALMKNMVLNDLAQKLLEEGKISIICHQSYQKFGLAHTDQVQGGVVFGACSKKMLCADDFQQFEKNAEMDLMNSIDMQVISFIQENTGPYLELIKRNHFQNGDMIQKYFMKQSGNNTYKIFDYDFLIKNPHESFFCQILKNDDPELYDAASKNLDYRQSFGHFNSTVSTIVADKSIRISAGASDKIDTLIQIIQLKLFSLFTHEQLFILLDLFVKQVNRHEISKTHEILLAGLLMAIKNSCYHPPELNETYKTIFIDGINLLIQLQSRFLFGRKSVETLYQFSINPQFYSDPDKKIRFIDKAQENISFHNSNSHGIFAPKTTNMRTGNNDSPEAECRLI